MKSLVVRLFIFVLMSSVLMSRSASALEVLGAVGASMNYQLASNGKSYEPNTPLGLQAGVRWPWADLFLEYSYMTASSGTDMVSIATTNQNVLLWIRKGDPTARTVKPYIALGAGANQQTVKTRIGSQTDSQPSDFEPMAAAALGLEFRVIRAISWTVEGRASVGEGLTPNPLFGLSSYLGFSF